MSPHSPSGRASGAACGAGASSLDPSVASSLALLGTGRASHANRLECVPASDLPTVGLADSLDTCVDHPPTRRVVRRGDNLPLSCLVTEAVANLKIRGEDFGVGCCLQFALLLGGRCGIKNKIE